MVPMETIKDRIMEKLEELKKEGKANVIYLEESSKMFDEIDRDLKSFRQEFSKKEKEAETEAASIQLTF
jgi:hypothetical protein